LLRIGAAIDTGGRLGASETLPTRSQIWHGAPMIFAVPEANRAVRRAGVAWALLAGAVLACSSPSVNKPPAPDMTGLVEAYQRPSASFDADSLPELVVAVAAIDELLERTSLRTELVNVLREVLDAAVDASTQVDDELDIDFEADGYMLITRVCAGWASSPSPDRAQNGALLVNATFSESGLDPTLWGESERCRYLSGDVQVELVQERDSADAMKVYWGEAIEAESLDERALIVDMSLSARLDGEELPLDFDFRSLADGTIEYRIERDGGSLIAGAGGDRVLVRAGNGTFDCSELDCSRIAESGEL
jgi:hypothetical protein